MDTSTRTGGGVAVHRVDRMRLREATLPSRAHVPLLPKPQLAISIMLKLPLHYEGDKLLDHEGRELTRAEIIGHLSVLNSVALAAELLEMYCPRPAIPRAVREDIDVALAALRTLK